MPVALTHPGVYIEEVSSGVRTITGVATSIALFIGWAARGATDRAVRITSFADYEREFGALDARSLLGYSVRHFFDNGGADAYVIRLSSGAGIATVTSGDLTVTAASGGEWANSYRVRLTPRPGVADRFKLEVLNHPTDESVVEVYEDLSMHRTDARFVGTTVNNRSRVITATVAASETAPAGIATVALTGGGNGTVLDPNDAATAAAFHAAVLAEFATGARADRIELFNIVCVPGESDATTIQTLQTRCHERRAFLIVDSTASATVANAATEAAARIGPHAHNAAFYFPWVRAPDPQQRGAIRAFPPCGFVAGVFARTDSTRGVWKAPAGSDATIGGAIGFEVPMSDRENGQLNPHAINCLRTLPVYGNVVWGSRTLVGDNDRGSEWKYVPVRRMALFLEESLYRGTQWVVFEPNDEPLWAQIRLNIGAFMQGLFRQGAFQGRSPREAYFVKCDRETTTQADINLGIVNIHVGFAPLKPAEFVVIRLQQIAGEIPT
jgi:phage tail sheath protein FI